MATIRPPVTADSLRKATWDSMAHVHGTGFDSLTYRSKAFPEATVCKGWTKKRGVKKHYAVIQVTHEGKTEEFPVVDLEGAAAAITKIRLVAVDDLEWEMTDPARREA